MSGEPVPVLRPPRVRSLSASLPTRDNNTFLIDFRRKTPAPSWASPCAHLTPSRTRGPVPCPNRGRFPCRSHSKPITTGPFTDFDPRSWTTYHGDGSWTCPGPDGTPLPTVRLENFRDGLEDYAYVRTLEATIAKVEASDELRAGRGGWLARAKGLLEVPANVLASKTEYTHDPAALYRWRDAVARAIEDAGTEPAYPW